MKELNLQETQQASFIILKKISEICEANNIKYFFYGGTLIGAVRHGGFIPWDDDIDISMPRPDYERFCKYCIEHKDELVPFKLFNLETCKDYPYMISRMSDTRYVLDVENEKDYGIGVFVDIYPLDGLGNDLAMAKKTMTKLRKYPRLFFLSTRLYYHFGITKGWKKRFLKFFAFIYAKLMGKQHFKKKILDKIDVNAYEHSRYVACAVWGAGSKIHVFDKDLFGEYTFIEFEGEKFRSFANYDYLLKEWFGDYMKLPPENERVPHHMYKTYKKD